MHGSPFSISELSLIDSNCAPVSCTRVTPHVIVEQGDHLMVKTDGGLTYRSVLVERVINTNTVVCTPDLEGVKSHGDLIITAKKEAYRVNYSQHLPPEEVLLRAISSEGQQWLQQNQLNTCLFVSWAITGKPTSVNTEELIKTQELKMVIPMSYKRINTENCHKVQPGDHLFVDYPRCYRWHFMVTEVSAEPNVFKTVYFLRGAVKETVETVDPVKLNVYRVMYAEEFSPDVAIERARSRVGDMKVSMWARLEFVRWAKTGSAEGVEVNFMANCSAPSSKSSIACFGQLTPGDYLIVEEHKLKPFHHCLIINVSSPEHCNVLEVWNRKVCQTSVELNPGKYQYYRLNYSSSVDVCRPAEESISLATEQLNEKSSLFSKQCRQTFVNYLKTGDVLHKVVVTSLQDDRLLLPRERVENAKKLRRGDHIERPLKKIGKTTDYCHHMLVLEPLDDRRCKVVHIRKGHHRNTGSAIRIEIVNLSEEGKVSRVIYAERIDPDKGIAQLLQVIVVNFTTLVHVHS